MKKVALSGVGGVLGLLLLGGFFWQFRDQFLWTPWSGELHYDAPSFVVADERGQSYRIDQNQRRIVKTTASGELAWTLKGESRDQGAFYWAEELALDTEGHLFVLNRVPDDREYFTTRSQVLQFSQEGRFLKIVAEKRYGPGDLVPTLVQRGHWHSLQTSAAREKVDLSWFESTPNGLFHWTTDGGVGVSQVIGGPADLLIPSAAVLPDGRVVYVTKQGRILREEASGAPSLLFDASEGVATPWKLQVRSDRIFFTDLARSGVAELLPDGSAPLLSEDASVRTTAARFSPAAVVLHWVLWIALVAGILLAAVDAYLGLKALRRSPSFVHWSLGIALSAALATSVITCVAANDGQRRSKEALARITTLARRVPQLIDTNRFEALDHPGRFGGDDYFALRRLLLEAVAGDWGGSAPRLTFALHRVWRGDLVTVLSLNGETALRHPLDRPEAFKGPLQRALFGEISTFREGPVLYALAPVRDPDGSVVGVLEVAETP